ncbi:MAG: DUF5658 family protein [Planococcus sp. (in: firmicutes)]|nr:DUF5658 family protein [Planococcus sp. (in: firmicutes)]
MSEQLTTPLKKPIWTLIVLNLADGFLTYWGLLSGAIEEANPLLSGLPPFAIFTLKVLLSACLAAFLFTPLVQLESWIWRYFLLATNFIYISILSLHIMWIVLLYL